MFDDSLDEKLSQVDLSMSAPENQTEDATTGPAEEISRSPVGHIAPATGDTPNARVPPPGNLDSQPLSSDLNSSETASPSSVHAGSSCEDMRKDNQGFINAMKNENTGA